MDVTRLVFHSNLDLLMSKLKVESVLLTSCLSRENNPSPLPAYVQAGGTLRSYQFDNREDCNKAKNDTRDE